MNNSVFPLVFNRFEQNFANFLYHLSPGAPESLRTAAALAARAVSQQHVCCRLDMPQLYFDGRVPAFIPSVESWRADLLRCPAVVSSEAATPLVLQGNRLYLQRYYLCERELAETIRRFATRKSDFDPVATGAALQPLFPHAEQPGSPEFRQRLAAFAAVRGRLAVISGGPGTGKTYTAARILALHAELAQIAHRPAPRLMLAAPTGKAAARLTQSIAAAAMTPTPPAAVTLHRLLGITPEFPEGRRNHRQPLPVDVAVVDEVSMVPLTLLNAFFSALPDHASVILLGDMHQLSSVEPGCVFGDLCRAGQPEAYTMEFFNDYRSAFGNGLEDFSQTTARLADATVELTVSRRFNATGGIGRLAEVVKNAHTRHDVDNIRQLIRQFSNELTELPCPENSDSFRRSGTTELRRLIREHYRPLLLAETAEAALAALDRFRILTATRVGPFGSETLNRLVYEWLGKPQSENGTTAFFRGRPLLIVENDRDADLFNGDTGIVFPAPDGRLAACFPARDGQGGVRFVPLSLLPRHETAFAMTVHKSQGSEFDELLLLLPDRPELFNRELVYTAITRTRRHLFMQFLPEALSAGILHDAMRTSGLVEQLTAQEAATSGSPSLRSE